MRVKTTRNYYIIIAALLFVVLIGCSSDPLSNNGSNSAKAPLEEKSEKTVDKDVYLEERNMGGLNSSQALKEIESLANVRNSEPKDAHFDEKTWSIRSGRVGTKVDVNKTLENVLNAKQGDKLHLVTNSIKPKISSDVFKSNIVIVASFTTSILDKKNSRMNNIRLACNAVNNTIITPGQEFSFNRTVGRRTTSKGYKEAPIIVKTPQGDSKKSSGVGGGICQLSSTISNAAEEAGLELAEKHEHTKSVGYVPKGEDATVAYGGPDLKIRNNKNFPVMIKAWLNRNTLSVQILEDRR